MLTVNTYQLIYLKYTKYNFPKNSKLQYNYFHFHLDNLSSAGSATPIIIAVVLLIVLVALIALFLYWKRQRREYSDQNGDDEEEAADLNIVKDKTDNL